MLIVLDPFISSVMMVLTNNSYELRRLVLQRFFFYKNNIIRTTSLVFKAQMFDYFVNLWTGLKTVFGY